jgi:RsmE family RNA methyltransferase
LLLALPRPPTLKKVLQASAAMGVKEIVLMHTQRVEKSFWGSPVLAEAALREQMLLGLEQGRDTVLPMITTERRFHEFARERLAGLLPGSRPLLAHPDATAECPRALASRVTLAVGPEGGFVPQEIDILGVHGFEAVSLGPRPLRVEHAVPALLGRLF